LREVDRVPLAGGNSKSSSLPLALSTDRRVLYAALRDPPYPVYSFDIQPESGALRPSGRIELPGCPAFIAADPSGRYLLEASYYNNHVGAIDLADSGTNGPLVLPGFTKAHSICFDHKGRYFYVGVVGDDQILQMRLQAEDRKLALVSRFQARRGTGPRHIALSADDRFLYAINETNPSIGSYAVAPRTGQLTELQTLLLVPGDDTARIAADVHLTPDGRLLYASVRVPPRIGAFAVEPADGRLTYIETVATEPIPRGFAITPEGSQIMAPGQETDKIAVFSIEPGSGRLARAEALTLPVAGSPSWILIL
jgi:6-phosphogluconolactonase